MKKKEKEKSSMTLTVVLSTELYKELAKEARIHNKGEGDIIIEALEGRLEYLYFNQKSRKVLKKNEPLIDVEDLRI